MLSDSDSYLAALPHNELTEIFPDVFFVTGTREWNFQDLHWQFSRNMTVLRDGDHLTLVNAVRLDEVGLTRLEGLGKITNVVQLGGLHGVDDAFYRDRFGAAYWAQPGAGQVGVPVDRTLRTDGELPIVHASLFVFETTKVPECILCIDREGGILVVCDALQNYVAPDAFFSDESARIMNDMGFFQRANVGPVWMQAAEPGAGDFRRLKTLRFRHVLCGHGEPVLETAQEEYFATFARLFEV